MWPGRRSTTVPSGVLISSIQPFGHNRYGPKNGGCAPFKGELGPQLTQPSLGRCLRRSVPCGQASSRTGTRSPFLVYTTVYKSSAVAEMGDRGHNRHGSKWVCNVGVLLPSGCMDQSETWHGGRLGPGHTVLDGYPAPPPKKKWSIAPNFWPMLVVAKRLDELGCRLVQR